MPRRYQIPQPVPNPVGTGLLKGFLFPTQQPSDRWFTRGADAMRTQSPPAPVAVQQGPSVQASSVFPQRISWAKVGGLRSLRGPGLSLIGNDQPPQTYEFLLAQPNQWAYQRVTDARRFPYDVTPHVHQGATRTAEFVAYTPTLPIADYYVRRPSVASVLPIGGPPPAAQGVYQPPPDPTIMPAAPRYTITVLRREIKGPAVLIPNPPIVATPEQPAAAWYVIRDTNRLVAVPFAQHRGPSIQPTYVFQLDQPERNRWNAQRAQPEVVLRPEGTIAQQQFIIPITQPDRAAWYVPRPQRDAEKHLTGVFIPPPVVQTYIFEPGQPSRTFWYVPRVAAVPQGPPIQTQGATLQRTDPIPQPTMPERQWWKPGPASQMFIVNLPTVEFRAAWVRFNTYVGPWTQEPE